MTKTDAQYDDLVAEINENYDRDLKQASEDSAEIISELTDPEEIERANEEYDDVINTAREYYIEALDRASAERTNNSRAQMEV